MAPNLAASWGAISYVPPPPPDSTGTLGLQPTRRDPRRDVGLRFGNLTLAETGDDGNWQAPPVEWNPALKPVEACAHDAREEEHEILIEQTSSGLRCEMVDAALEARSSRREECLCAALGAVTPVSADQKRRSYSTHFSPDARALPALSSLQTWS